jgi:hypothetical protein
MSEAMPPAQFLEGEVIDDDRGFRWLVERTEPLEDEEDAICYCLGVGSRDTLTIPSVKAARAEGNYVQRLAPPERRPADGGANVAEPPHAAFQARAIVDLLNSAVHCDPAAIHALCEVRVPCSDRLAGHPSGVCAPLRCGSGEGTEYPVVGLLGILNGLVWETGHVVAMELSDSGSLVRFRTVKRQDVEILPEEP